MHIDILRTVSAFRTILAFTSGSQSSNRRRPRIGQVADEIGVIGEALYSLRVVDQDGRSRLLETADAVRSLS